MLKNNKLLYILPEMAFTASVGETPKQDYYFVQTFHQINGEFMKDENFIHESLKKLFERVEEAQYTLVLPDFLFTDTIVNVPETDDVKIAQYLRDQLLPRIEVSTFSHETRTSVLLQRKTTSKVQLSAFEKELAASLKLAIGNREVILDEIVPLSWALKAAVSLEPSLTIAQVGERLYLAEHYIGINQTISTPIDDLDVLAETVRTLKGSDPNLQTTYLFTSQLVEEKLKKFLLKTLPVQQLTEPIEEEAKIPPYVKQIIEVSARTLSLSGFAVPRFSIKADDLLGAIPTTLGEDKPTPAPVVEPEVSAETIDNPVAQEVEAVSNAVARSLDLEAATETKDLVEASNAAEKEKTEETKSPESATAASESLEVSKPESLSTPGATDSAVKTATTEATVSKVAPEKETTSSAIATTTPQISAPVVSAVSLDPVSSVSESATSTPMTSVQAAAETIESKPTATVTPAPQLSFMTPKSEDTQTPSTGETEAKTDENDKTAAKSAKKDGKISADKKLVSKKKGNMSSFVKKMFLFLLIFVIVIALGIGVGILILTMNGKDFFKADEVPEPEMSVAPTPAPEVVEEPVATKEAEVEPEPEEEIDPAEYNILVVNATSIGGLAGKAKTALETAGFKDVKTGNAAGEYEEDGTFVLMTERNRALITLLEEATGRTMTYDEDIKVEDAAGKYDAVIVLNEE